MNGTDQGTLPSDIWTPFRNKNTGELVVAVRLTRDVFRELHTLNVKGAVLFDERRLAAVVNSIDKSDWGYLNHWLVHREDPTFINPEIQHDDYTFIDPVTFSIDWRPVA